MNTPEDIQNFLEILSRFEKGEATDAEKVFVEQYFAYLEARPGRIQSLPAAERDSIEQAISKRLDVSMQHDGRVHFMKRGWVRYAAAAVLLFAMATTYLLVNKKETAITDAQKVDVAPGREGSKLKLADGRIILVDTAKEGLLAVQGSMSIFKENGKIVYKGKADELVYNEIISERKQFSTAVLPDGTTVWLNAGSSLRYPLKFTGGERKVAMTGQVSFLVKHDALHPFRVEVSGQTIEDIGTEFDINAYRNEPVVLTTLIEGSASVTKGQKKVILVPGQQAVTNSQKEGIDVLEGINTDNVIAWRIGKFKFDNADMRTVMRQLERWYDVEIVFEGEIPDRPLVGGTFRNEQLSEVLHTLELSGVAHFRIEGTRVYVSR